MAVQETLWINDNVHKGGFGFYATGISKDPNRSVVLFRDGHLLNEYGYISVVTFKSDWQMIK